VFGHEASACAAADRFSARVVASSRGCEIILPPSTIEKEINMSKGEDRKKETKKKPEKTLKEKRAAKAAKRG